MANNVCAEDPETEFETYLDGDEFKAYAEMIREFIHASEIPVCTRDIHFWLGDNARREWTGDALEAIADIEEVGLLPTRYQPAGGRTYAISKFAEEFGLRRFFPNRPRDFRPEDLPNSQGELSI
jgi:hypothetical protein